MRPPKGCLDPHEDLAFSMELCRGRGIQVLLSHGYRPVCPPSLQRLDSLMEVLEPPKAASIIALTSPHGEACALNFDVTISAVLKLVRQKAPEERPLRICYAERAYRKPEPPGEDFESYQLGAEIIGWDGEGADCEALFLASLALTEMGIQSPTFALGNPSLISRIFKGLPRDAARSLTGCLKRRDFTSYVRMVDQLGPQWRGLKDIPDLRGGAEVLEALWDREGIREDRAYLELKRLWDFANQWGIKAILDLSLTRNPDYYSGPVFDFYDPNGMPLGGGGRYDGLLKRCGVIGQAVGFSIDLKATGQASSLKMRAPAAMVWCAPLPPLTALEFTRRLSQQGIPFEISWHQRPQQSMEAARIKGIPWWLDPSAGLALNLVDKRRSTVSRFMEEVVSQC
ncbi:ATP phosphoribosyltransferase involved in histidine biosynthesis [Thermanaerovibrio velox DSM 12556]|uniref:ATP phosphoribosyltransferase involved in histidine biosynthesis n=1 Tax=Thermanaerovibrio velox DSM 12556 TaxID=926567 RepID=H0UPX8_9BACT|nr:ATP phosphoribosyltransferase regulatory subunit [Thermanaerovibrio velox]EHM10687.1 ATP phosphoribosyltransferase involved in histidine biosynthesis [Thermanaerovibrio velox DSM 12556]